MGGWVRERVMHTYTFSRHSFFIDTTNAFTTPVHCQRLVHKQTALCQLYCEKMSGSEFQAFALFVTEHDEKLREKNERSRVCFLFFNALSVNQWKVEVNQFGGRDKERIFL